METIKNNANTKELKLDLVELVQKKNEERKAEELRTKELTERNAKAKAYSKTVQRKVELRNKIIVAAIGIPMLATGIIFGAMGVQNVLAREIMPTETETRTETAILVDIDDETGDYILQTEDGNLWGIQDGEEIFFELEFSNNGNETEDDVIIGVELMK